MKAVTISMFLLLFALIGCISENEPIANIEWKLTTLNNKPVSELNFERVPTIKFIEDENKLAGFAGCNNYFGSFKVTGNRIEFGTLGSTQMACPNLDFENQYLKLLDKINNFECNGNELKLYSDENLTLVFTK